MTKKLPMLATGFRFLCGPLIGVLAYFQAPNWQWLSLFLFAMGGISDWLDGYWARKYNAVTNLGKLLDPAADKVMVSTTLILFLWLERIDFFCVLLLINRDVMVSALRSFVATKGVALAAGSMGKWKTAVQMMGLGLLFVPIDLGPTSTFQLGVILVWLSVILSWGSAWQYFVLGWKHK